jgi:hypothetical protein
MRSLQSEIEQRGRQIFELVDNHPESLFSKAGFYQRLMALSMRDEQLKLQLFRFVDVLPSLGSSGEIVEHLQEYFADANGSPDEIRMMSCGHCGSAARKKLDSLSISWGRPSLVKRRPTSMRRVIWIYSRVSQTKQKTGPIRSAKIQSFSQL